MTVVTTMTEDTNNDEHPHGVASLEMPLFAALFVAEWDDTEYNE